MAGDPDDVDAMIEPVVPSRHRWLAGLLPASPATGWSTWAAASAARWPRPPRRSPAGCSPGWPSHLGCCASRPTSRRPLPLADGAFDRVLCHNVPEVLPDPDALVAEAIRVLEP